MATKYEYYDSGDDDIEWGGDVYWYAQTFTPSTAHKITSVKVKVDHLNSPGTVTVGIRATSGGLPTGDDLCTGTFDGDTPGDGSSPYSGEWVEVDLGDGADLSANTKYAIVMRAPSCDYPTDRFGWRVDRSSPTYAGGADCYSNDGGSSWTERTNDDLLFEDWGVVGWTGKVSGVADPAKVMEVDVANIASVKGVT